METTTIHTILSRFIFFIVLIALWGLLTSCGLFDRFIVNVSGSYVEDAADAESAKVVQSKAIADLTSLEVAIFTGEVPVDDKFPQTTNLNEDGSFSFNVFEGQNFVAFLIDPAKEYQKVLGVIGISVGGQEYWESIDTEWLEDDLYLGRIRQSSETVEEILVSEFALSELIGDITDYDKARRTATFDNSVRLLKNAINSDGVLIGAGASWISVSVPGGFSANQWTNPEEYEIESEYNIIMGGAGNLMLVNPPSAASIRAPFDLHFPDGSAIPAGTPIPPSDTSIISADRAFLAFGPFYELVSGYWQVYDGDSRRLEIDVAGTSATVNDKLIQPVPALRLNSNETTGRITGLDIRWYLLGDDEEYAPVTETDLQLLEEVSTSGYSLTISNIADNSGSNNYDYSYRAAELSFPNELFFLPDNHILVEITSGIWGLGGTLQFEFFSS